MYDQSVVKRVMNGDSQAYAKMYEDCAPAVYRRAYDLLQDHSLAREAVRRTFLDIYHSVSQLRQSADFDEWVYRLVNYHAERLKKADKIWDQPDLKMVWDELRELVNLDNDVVDGVASEIESGDEQDENWKPILFPPDEDTREQEIASMPWKQDSDNFYEKDERDQKGDRFPEPDGRIAKEDDSDEKKIPVRTEQNEVVLPPPPPGFKGLRRSGKRSRRVRYESARAQSPHYTIERVPYDYLPYDEASQAAYDRIEFEESPSAVYEVVPYRYHKNPEGNVEETIPYSASQSNEEDSNVVSLQKAPDVDETIDENSGRMVKRPDRIRFSGDEESNEVQIVDAGSEIAEEIAAIADENDKQGDQNFAAISEISEEANNDVLTAAQETIDVDDTTVAIIDQDQAESGKPKKKRFYAGAPFFIGIIAILGILIYLGFHFGILE